MRTRAKRRSSDEASLSLTFGILGILTGVLGFVFGPLAISKARAAVKRSRENRAPTPGSATAGSILGIISLLQAVLCVLWLLAFLGPGDTLSFPGFGSGTITFAEEVDLNTLSTTNEGTVFTTGYVAMVVRGNGRFGDSRMVVSYRERGEAGWQILGEYTVDPDWDIYAVVITLVDPGLYEVAAKTGSGGTIARNYVEILP